MWLPFHSFSPQNVGFLYFPHLEDQGEESGGPHAVSKVLGLCCLALLLGKCIPLTDKDISMV